MVQKTKITNAFLPAQENNRMTVLIHKGCEFEGKLSFEGTARIDGHFKGQIFTKDILIIGEGALVEADVEADVVIVHGNFRGNITALNRVELKYPGVLKGQVCTPVFSMDEGVIFDGQAKMVQNAADLTDSLANPGVPPPVSN